MKALEKGIVKRNKAVHVAMRDFMVTQVVILVDENTREVVSVRRTFQAGGT